MTFLGIRQGGVGLQSPAAVTVTVTLLFHELIKAHLDSSFFRSSLFILESFSRT